MQPSARLADQLAAAYATARDPRLREQLCELGLPLVRKLATFVSRRLPVHFCIDDLIGDGCIGLLRAIDRYDPKFNVSFETWASRIIRGAMLNGLRRMDAVPERVRRDARNLDSARWRLAVQRGESPNDGTAAANAGLSSRKLRAVQSALRSAAILSLDAPMPWTSATETAILSEFVSSPEPDPAARVARNDLRRVVAQAIAALPPRDRLIVAAFYGAGASFRQIGNRFGISKQRVSQLHNRALAGMRKSLAAHFGYVA